MHVETDNVTKIGYASFQGCGEIENITMGDQVTHTDGYAFSDMTKLKSVTLSASLKQIAYPTERGFNSNSGNIFQNSTSLEKIYFRSVMPPSFLYTKDIETLYQESPKLTIYVPQGTLNAYKNSD